MLAFYEVVKYLCLEMDICVIYMPKGLSENRNFKPLQNDSIHNYKITRAIILLM